MFIEHLGQCVSLCFEEELEHHGDDIQVGSNVFEGEDNHQGDLQVGERMMTYFTLNSGPKYGNWIFKI